MNIGDKVELWETEWKNSAYTDQIGRSHGAYVVIGRVIATIAETKDVPCAWTPQIFYDAGIKAVDEFGAEYYLNWDSFPSDSMTPCFYWFGKMRQFVSAKQASGSCFGPYVNTDGTKAEPLIEAVI